MGDESGTGDKTTACFLAILPLSISCRFRLGSLGNVHVHVVFRHMHLLYECGLVGVDKAKPCLFRLSGNVRAVGRTDGIAYTKYSCLMRFLQGRDGIYLSNKSGLNTNVPHDHCWD